MIKFLGGIVVGVFFGAMALELLGRGQRHISRVGAEGQLPANVSEAHGEDKRSAEHAAALTDGGPRYS